MVSGDEHPSGGTIFKCADCGVERCDAEEGNGLQHLDSCPNCGSESVPVAAGTWSAREHPSGLRDAIEEGIREYEGPPWSEERLHIGEYIEASVTAWLSVVSEGEIYAWKTWIASVRSKFQLPADPEDVRDWRTHVEYWRGYTACLHDVALFAASRGVLLPKEMT